MGFKDFYLTEFTYQSPKLFLPLHTELTPEDVRKFSSRGSFLPVEADAIKNWKKDPVSRKYNYIYSLPPNIKTLDFNNPRTWEDIRSIFREKRVPIFDRLSNAELTKLDKYKIKPLLRALVSEGIIGLKYGIVKIGKEYLLSVDMPGWSRLLKLVAGNVVAKPFDDAETGKLDPSIVEMIRDFVGGDTTNAIKKLISPRIKAEIHKAYPPVKMSLYRGISFDDNFESSLKQYGITSDDVAVGNWLDFRKESPSHWTDEPRVAQSFIRDVVGRSGMKVFGLIVKMNVPANNIVVDVSRVGEIDKWKEEHEVIVHEVPGMKARITNIFVHDHDALSKKGFRWNPSRKRLERVP